MSYLHPPPGDAPVVVMKDVGGYVDQYDAQTALYGATNREVRLHECRSACTLALSLPNVCVYPSSLLKFHKAYNPITKQANEDVSRAMMEAYPTAVRQRLGDLTRQYKVLTGSELIRLGIRDCNSPQQPHIMIARARTRENPPENPVSNAFSGLVAALSPQQGAPASGAQVKIQRVKVQVAQIAPATPTPAPAPVSAPVPVPAPGQTGDAAKPGEPGIMPAPALAAAPPPPPRPAALAIPPAPEAAVLAPEPSAFPVAAPTPAPGVIPTPTPRPPDFTRAPPTTALTNWGRPIKGSAAILVSAHFAPFPYRLAGGR
jgi:hypothetical protein